MKKRFCLSGLALAFIGLGVVHGQDPTSPPVPAIMPPPGPPARIAPPTVVPPAGVPGAMTFPDATPALAAPSGPPPASEGVSSWLAYPRPAGCCGQVGGHGPIDSELYFRAGSAAPVGGGIFGNVMKPGLDVQGGLRVLWFNPAETAAWTADLGLENANFNTQTKETVNLRNFNSVTPNGVGGTNTTVIPEFPVTPSGLNNTTLKLALGREWYLWGSTFDCKCKDPKWRVGVDLGGDWGSQKLVLDEIPHKTVMVGGFFAALHSDVEIPCGCCIIYGGVRVEYNYLYSDILQIQNDTDLQTISATLTLGFRY